MYAGPKTWLPGWDGELGYGTYYKITNAFENRSINSWARRVHPRERVVDVQLHQLLDAHGLRGLRHPQTEGVLQEQRYADLHRTMSRLFLTVPVAALAAAASLIATLRPAGAATLGVPVAAVTRAVPAFARARIQADRIPPAVARRTAVRLLLSSSRRIAARVGRLVFVAPSADGKFVYTINSQSGNIGVFAINQQDGSLTSLGQAGDFPKSVGFNGIAAL